MLGAEPRLRTISDIVLHIMGVRAHWFHDLMEVGDVEFAELGTWDRKGAPTCDATELVNGLETTWHLIEHDLHHGGKVSLLPGMHGLEAPAL